MAQKSNPISKIKKFARRHTKQLRFFGTVVVVCAFAITGASLLSRGKAAPGACSTSDVIGTTTHTVTVPATGQYRLWVRMQVPDTTNTGNLNGVHVELNSNQCFAVTTTRSDAVNQWQWINSSATAASTAHVTSSLNAGTNTVKIIGKKNDVRVDKLLLLSSSSTCTPSNNFNNGQPGENCTTPPPSVTFTSSPTSVTSGGSSTLNWSSTNATSCTASGDWSGSKAASGSESRTNITQNRTYNLSCTGPGGTSAQSASVTVQTPAPTLTFSANPLSVTSGGNSNLSWSSTNATSCTASGAWSGSKATSGSQSTSTLTSNQTYTLSCAGAGGNISRNVTITVQAPSDPPVISMDFPGLTVPSGATSVKVTETRGATWTPTVSSVSGIQSVTYRVNGSQITLTNGQYVIGASANGDYTIEVTATANNGQTASRSLQVRVRHPDFSRNGRVDLIDLSMLLKEWGKSSIPHDINTNNVIDLYDLSFVLSRWGS